MIDQCVALLNSQTLAKHHEATTSELLSIIRDQNGQKIKLEDESVSLIFHSVRAINNNKVPTYNKFPNKFLDIIRCYCMSGFASIHFVK